MSNSNYVSKALEVKENALKLKEKIESNREGSKLNIDKLKELKSSFSKQFGQIVNDLEKIPQDLISTLEEEESPAAARKVVNWEWEFKNGGKFQKDGDLYKMNSSCGTVQAFSSHCVNEDFKYKIKFTDTTSFGCAGFGIISKSDNNFSESGNFSSSGSNPLFCLCCTGPWSAKYMNKKSSENMQSILKRAEDKMMTFEVSFSEGLFKVYDCYDVLFADYELNKLSSQIDLVLIFYGSGPNHSHEIICE